MKFTIKSNNINHSNDKLIEYFEEKGFKFQSSSSSKYLSPPDKNGNQYYFYNLKTIGCTMRSIVWFENSGSLNEFSVTIYSTLFGKKTNSDQIKSDIDEILRNGNVKS